MSPDNFFAVILGVLAFIFIIFFLWSVHVGLWINAKFAGVKVRPFRDLLAMRLRRVPPASLVNSLITATKAGLKVNLDKLEAHYLAGVMLCVL